MNNPKEVFLATLIKVVKSTSPNLEESKVESSVDYCDYRFGEFSTNICFALAKELDSNPLEVSKSIVDGLSQSNEIDFVEFRPPGFINVRMKPSVWLDYISAINHNYASSNIGEGQSVQLEFISANPTGPLVLTNAWQGYYGDILANIFESQGYKTQREYYLNDGGNQIVSLGKAVQQSLGMEFDEEVAKELYRGEYINRVAEVIVDSQGENKKVLEADPKEIGQKAAKIILDDYIKPDLARLEVEFDTIYSETKPDIKKTLKRLDDSGLLKEKDGAVWLDGSKVGLNQDEVLVRSYDKEYSYFLKDIAYQLERLEERGFDKTITIVGPDHHGQSIRLVNTLKQLGHEGFNQISTQTIRLVKDGQEFKMSKRKGNYILLDDFLDSVPSEAARFYFGMRDTNTHMDFDIDLVKEHSAKNPVYYSLYAYARACSIEQKAAEEGLKAGANNHYELTDQEKRLFMELSKVGDILSEVTVNYKAHKLLHQIYEIAKSFHEYYESERIVGSKQASEKLYLIAKFKLAYEALFAIVGVTLLERM